MFRGGANPQGLSGGGGVNGGGNAEDRLEMLKRQFHNGDGGAAGPGGSNNQGDEAGNNNNNNGLSLHLQEQYDQHDAEQQNAAKRQRGMGNGDFVGGAMGNNNSNNMGAAGGMGLNPCPTGMVGSMNNPGNDNMNNNNGANNNNNGTPGGANFGNGNMNNNQMAMMNGMGSPNAGGMMNGMNMNGMNMNNAAAMNAMAGGMGMNPMGMQGMNGMNNMNSMNGMNPMAGGGMGMNGMNNMNNSMNAAMAGGMGMQGMNPMNMGGMNGMNMAARAGMLGGAGGMGASDDLAAALYFQDFQNPAARMGLLGQRDPFMVAAQGLGGNPFGDYGRLGGAQNPYSGLTGFPNAGAPAPGAGMGPNSRRAQIMALMDMENSMQHSDASKANGGQGSRGNELGDTQPTQIPEPPMDIPTFSTASTPAILPLPPVIEEGAAPHFSQRSHIPLGIDEDNNWLTEFQCFIRFDLIEVVQASRHVDQGKGSNSNNSGETFQQIGVRCRYCAHLHPGQRSSRSSAFPSSIRQLYQSFTMMLRDHFEQCSEIPPLRKKLFSELKAKNSQGAYDSKQYWIYAAEKLGMVDSEHGIQMTAESQAIARRKSPFGTIGDTKSASAPPKLLVSPEDIRITSDFLYTLMSQVQVVHLIDSERVGKRKTLRVGLPGFGCRYCCHVGRCGLSRMFPLRRRMLPGKVNEIYEHFKRCTLFPTKEKELLSRLKTDDRTSVEQEKEFFDRIWERLGCESEVKK